MEAKNKTYITFGVILLFLSPAFVPVSDLWANEDSKYLDAVREFADNVLKYGRDTYGPKHTPLFVDGLNVNTHEPVKWISPKGGNPLTATETEEWILSNFASQQTLLRTLDGLSALTDDPKYRNAAEQAVRYAFDNLRAANGLFYWGDCAAYDAQADTTRDLRGMHCLKTTYPYYELMWRVDRNAARKFIEAFWSAHVLDWSNLDFCRDSVPYTSEFETSWEHEYRGGPTFFSSNRSWGKGFFHTGTSLVYGAATLYQLSGQEPPLVWGKRLIQRFMDTRNPKTGISAHLYNQQPQRMFPNEDMREHFADPYTTVFPHHPFAKMRQQSFRYNGENWQPLPWISLFMTGHMLDEDGEEFTQWALEELTAWTKASYRASDNLFVPILTDGTNIEGVILEADCGLGVKGDFATALFASPAFFWLYATAYQMTGDELMWQIARDIGTGNGFGNIGQTPRDAPQLQSGTDCSDVYGLLGFLDLYRKTHKPEFLAMGRHIADNVVKTKFHQGFFVPSNAHVYARFDFCEPLALLHLVALLDDSGVLLPQVWPTSAKFGVESYRYKDGYPTDHDLIYRLTDTSEVPWSLAEVAHIGDIEKLELLLASGLDVDGQDDNWQRTPLQRAAIRGHMDVVKLLIAHGARVDHTNPHGPSQTPLSYAVQYGHRDIVELLIEQSADINANLFICVDLGLYEKIKDLLAQGIDINVKDDKGNTPLLYAAKEGNEQLVRFLIEQGADINVKGENGYTALYYAIRYGHSSVITFLLDNGADVNARNKRASTPLHSAAAGGRRQVAEVLITNGADLNAKDQNSLTPLHRAVFGGHKDVVECLIANGADINIKNRQGWTALDLAKRIGRTEIVDLLRKHGAKE